MEIEQIETNKILLTLPKGFEFVKDKLDSSVLIEQSLSSGMTICTRFGIEEVIPYHRQQSNILKAMNELHNNGVTKKPHCISSDTYNILRAWVDDIRAIHENQPF